MYIYVCVCVYMEVGAKYKTLFDTFNVCAECVCVCVCVCVCTRACMHACVKVVTGSKACMCEYVNTCKHTHTHQHV